jgi:hypothetical protein
LRKTAILLHPEKKVVENTNDQLHLIRTFGIVIPVTAKVTEDRHVVVRDLPTTHKVLYETVNNTLHN